MRLLRPLALSTALAAGVLLARGDDGPRPTREAVAGGAGAPLVGPVRVKDGDTLALAGQDVRLFGIDAPELGVWSCTREGRPWDCAGWARDTLARLTEGRLVTCTPRGRDGWGRTVAVCTAGGEDLGEALVRAGAAVAFTRYALDYVAAEKEAAIAGRGLWSGTFTAPETVRAERRALPGPAPAPPAVRRMPAPAAAAPPEGCRIKGNISENGRIYHLPGQRDYDRTRIDPAAGERWFCTEAEARAAGWRPAAR